MDNLWIWFVVEDTYPSEKYEFVNWDDDSQDFCENKSHVPVTTNQVCLQQPCHQEFGDHFQTKPSVIPIEMRSPARFAYKQLDLDPIRVYKQFHYVPFMCSIDLNRLLPAGKLAVCY